MHNVERGPQLFNASSDAVAAEKSLKSTAPTVSATDSFPAFFFHFISLSLSLSFFFIEHRDSDRQVTVSMARSSAHSALSIRHRDKLTDKNE